MDKCHICKTNNVEKPKSGVCKRCYERERGRRRLEKIRLDPILFAEHRKRYAELARKRRKNNPEVIEKDKQSCKKWYYKNKEKRSDYYKKYYQENKLKHQIRARKREYGENYLKALERDGFKCVSCGVTEYGQRRLHIHHLDGMGSQVKKEIRNNSLENLITLCPLCHRREEKKRMLI